MPRLTLHHAAGTGVYRSWASKSIRFAKFGCTNRPFYHIVVAETMTNPRRAPIEQLGSYDPSENINKEKLVSFNFERIQWWLGQGNVKISQPVEELLGLCGFLPIHPRTYMKAWRNRRAADEAAAKAAAEATAEAEKSAAEAS